MGVCQCPVAFAKPAIPKNSTAIPAAIAHAGSTRGFGAPSLGKPRYKAACAGQTATHSRQPVHSTDLMETSLSTGSDDGQALAHFAQSMQASGSRRIFAGLIHDVSPNSAP